MLPTIAPTRRLTAPRGSRIYAYCNHFTKQIIYSLSRTLDNTSSIAQLPFAGKKSVPRALRKDHWRPFFTVKFGSPDRGLQAYQSLREWRILREHNIGSQDLVAPLEPTPELQDERDAEFERLQDLGGERIGGPRTRLSTVKKQKMYTIKQQRANSIADLASTLSRQETESPRLRDDEVAADRELARRLGHWASDPAAAVSNAARSIQAVAAEIAAQKQKTGQLERQVLSRRIRTLNTRMRRLNIQLEELGKFRHVVLPRILNVLQMQATSTFKSIFLQQQPESNDRALNWRTVDLAVAEMSKDAQNRFILPLQAEQESHQLVDDAQTPKIASLEAKEQAAKIEVERVQEKLSSLKAAMISMGKASPGYAELKRSLDSTSGQLTDQELALEEAQFSLSEIKKEVARSLRHATTIEQGVQPQQTPAEPEAESNEGDATPNAVQDNIETGRERVADIKSTQSLRIDSESINVSPLSAMQLLQQNGIIAESFFTELDSKLNSIVSENPEALIETLGRARTEMQAQVSTDAQKQNVSYVFETVVGGYGPLLLSFDWSTVLRANKTFIKEHMPNLVSTPVRNTKSSDVLIEWSDEHDRFNAESWPEAVQHYQMGLAPRVAPDVNKKRVTEVADAFDYDLDGTELGARPTMNTNAIDTVRTIRTRSELLFYSKEERNRMKKLMTELKDTKHPEAVLKNKKVKLHKQEKRLVLSELARKRAYLNGLTKSPILARLEAAESGKSKTDSRILAQLRQSAPVAETVA